MDKKECAFQVAPAVPQFAKASNLIKYFFFCLFLDGS